MFILGFGDSMVEGAAPEECSFLKSFPFSHSLLFSLLLLPALSRRPRPAPPRPSHPTRAQTTLSAPPGGKRERKKKESRRGEGDSEGTTQR